MSENEDIKLFIHPEIKEGEVYLGNFTEKDYYNVMFETKRIGEHTYDISGNLYISNITFPVFVNEEEYKKHIESTGRNYLEFKINKELKEQEILKNIKNK